MIAALAPYAMALIIAVAMVIEARTGKIPNWLTLIPPVLFAVVAFTAPELQPFLWQLAFAAAVFAFGIFLFAMAGFAAGAVKLMGGVALFIPISSSLLVLVLFAIAMLLCTFLVVQLRKAFGSEESKWHVMAKPVVPMSLPIGITALIAIFFF